MLRAIVFTGWTKDEKIADKNDLFINPSLVTEVKEEKVENIKINSLFIQIKLITLLLKTLQATGDRSTGR